MSDDGFENWCGSPLIKMTQNPWDLACQAWQAAKADEAERFSESVRCMSLVFDDIATLVGLPEEQYGDPDALIDAIESLKNGPLYQIGFEAGRKAALSNYKSDGDQQS